MLHWFDEVQFDEQGQFVYTYFGLGDYIATTVLIFAIMLTLFKLCLTFRHYIYSGEFGDYEKSMFMGMMDGNHISKTWRYLFIGYHPGGIGADFMGMILLSILCVPFWSVYIVGTLFVLLAVTMRKRIAHKQTYIGNLKGDQLE